VATYVRYIAFTTEQALVAHIDSEHPESRHAEVF
jgi:hypothetical protein